MTPKPNELRKVKQLRATIEPGDFYLKGPAVYRVAMYDETDKKVRLETTNDDLGMDVYAWTPRDQLRALGFAECPLALRRPAYDIWDLRDKPTRESIEALERYRNDNKWVYEKFLFEDLFGYIDRFETRPFRVPEAMADVSGNLLPDQLVRIAYLFHSFTKEDAKQLYKHANVDTLTYAHAMRFQSWPVVFVPKRFS